MCKRNHCIMSGQLLKGHGQNDILCMQSFIVIVKRYRECTWVNLNGKLSLHFHFPSTCSIMNRKSQSIGLIVPMQAWKFIFPHSFKLQKTNPTNFCQRGGASLDPPLVVNEQHYVFLTRTVLLGLIPPRGAINMR